MNFCGPNSNKRRFFSAIQFLFNKLWIQSEHFLTFGSGFSAHLLQGIYSLEDLDRLVGTKLPTINTFSPTFWEISKCKGVCMYTCMFTCTQQNSNFFWDGTVHCFPGPLHWECPHNHSQSACTQWLRPHHRPCKYSCFISPSEEERDENLPAAIGWCTCLLTILTIDFVWSGFDPPALKPSPRAAHVVDFSRVSLQLHAL